MENQYRCEKCNILLDTYKYVMILSVCYFYDMDLIKFTFIKFVKSKITLMNLEKYWYNR